MLLVVTGAQALDPVEYDLAGIVDMEQHAVDRVGDFSGMKGVALGRAVAAGLVKAQGMPGKDGRAQRARSGHPRLQAPQ